MCFQEREGKPGGGKGLLNQGDRTGALSTLTNQCIALDGDKLKPREDQRKGGNVIVSTNSNGEDVAATLTRDLAKQTGAQQQNGGGYILTRREDSALTDSGSTETGR